MSKIDATVRKMHNFFVSQIFVKDGSIYFKPRTKMILRSFNKYRRIHCVSENA